MNYWRFLAGNALGGVVWACASVLAGYLAGDAWHRIARVEHIVGLVLLAAVAAAFMALKARRFRHRRATS